MPNCRCLWVDDGRPDTSRLEIEMTDVIFALLVIVVFAALALVARGVESL
jgi:hypothetical protein